MRAKDDKLRQMSLVDKAVSMLAEHFEIVEVGVSWHDNTGTHVLHHGAGNTLARRALSEDMVEYNACSGEEVGEDESSPTF